jgi:thioredoxin reductase (NADPH)
VRDEYDVAVAGGGLAGLTAGLTAARLGRSVLVLTGAIPGGLLLSIERIDGLPGFPNGVAGYELCPTVQQQADEAGAEIVGEELERMEPEDGTWAIATADGGARARAVIVSTGASFRRLGLSGEERLQGRGISTCASCDGPLLGGRLAVVVGGGDSALQEALTLADAGGPVVIVHRAEELDGQETYRLQVAAREAIDVRCRAVVEEILGDEAVRGVRIRDLASNAVEELEAGAVFPFVGLRPNVDRFHEQVALDAKGAVVTDEALRTTAVGVFAAGIVRSGARARAASVAGEGAAAALASDAFLRDGEWPLEPSAAAAHTAG